MMRELIALLVLMQAWPAWAADCSLTGASLPPAVAYTRSAALEAAAVAAASTITPRLADGAPDAAGKLCLVSLGMSNLNQAADGLKRVWRQSYRALTVPGLVLVNAGQYGKDLPYWDEPTDETWAVVDARLASAGCTRQQVAALWLMVGTADVPGSGPSITEAQARSMVAIAHDLYPYAAVAYISSLQTTLYGPTFKLPEPQPRADAELLAQAVEGAPWAIPTLFLDVWSQGEIVNPTTGYGWVCADAADDGGHISKAGANKIGASIWQRWATDPVMAWAW